VATGSALGVPSAATDNVSTASGAAEAAAPVATGSVAAPRPPSQKRLRELLRTSSLVSPELRVHWLRILPYLTAEQRRELAALLGGDGLDRPAAGP
jgi:hypothetical protein